MYTHAYIFTYIGFSTNTSILVQHHYLEAWPHHKYTGTFQSQRQYPRISPDTAKHLDFSSNVSRHVGFSTTS